MLGRIFPGDKKQLRDRRKKKHIMKKQRKRKETRKVNKER
jgi:hypothetical protein